MNKLNTNIKMPQGGACSLSRDTRPDTEKLRVYTHTKLAVADRLRMIRGSLATLGHEKAEKQVEELMIKLAEDRFVLAVLGQFKRGKSSLMNAIIGQELLPAGVLPLTSAITVLKYGPAERLVINRDSSIFPEELPVSSLPEYVTERDNPGNRKKVKTACLELPVPFLRRGVEFVDTPGIGSAIMANTATTYGFLPECDAVLFVTSADIPMTSAELDFLKEIREYADKIFFVLNKTDLVSGMELEEVVGFVTETIRTTLGTVNVKIFPVSARLALDAKMSGDVLADEEWGLKSLEEELASFLSGEKMETLLAAIARKALRILDEEVEAGTLDDAALQFHKKEIHEEKPGSIQGNPREAIVAINEARIKFESLYSNIIDGRLTEKMVTEFSSWSIKKPQSSKETKPSLSITDATDITADLQTRECPVCQHLAKQAYNFFSQWQYRLGSEEKAQADFASELGFCPLHTWQLLEVSSPHGASVGFARLAEAVSNRLKTAHDQSARGKPLQQLLYDSRNCRVCKLLEQEKNQYIRQLAAFISSDSGLEQYERSQGACLYHLRMLVDATGSAQIREFLLFHASRRFEEDAEDMRSYTLKYEALRRSLQHRDEKDAYLRTVMRLAGSRSMCTPWAKDGETG